ncbi:Flp family type IVb pilin [Novosphingobium sp. Gsoil 351]|uniref:Flp family type IVb pilin n=1 Tax=Novosphingobium sp. Gsoil 351 TaxID=2675225 RepID=UPI0012B49511|nr:Flp family type IVb pilin [Novosphingobium sp. Gsoil 351]QGN53710.1 Flp family type IVb pilin [Novosphingobium sp. Gsoil 351]
MLKFMRHILRTETGATAVEYGLIASLIVIAIIGALNSFATSANTMFSKIETSVSQAGN